MSEREEAIRKALDTFEMGKAHELLREALKENPTAETYYLAARAALSESQRIAFLEKAVQLDPFHKEANSELDRLRRPETPIKLPAPVAPTATPPDSANLKLLREAVSVFLRYNWKLTMDTSNFVKLEKSRGVNTIVAIALTALLTWIGFLIVFAVTNSRKETITIEALSDGLRVSGKNVYTTVTDSDELISLAGSVPTPVSNQLLFWIMIAGIVFYAIISASNR